MSNLKNIDALAEVEYCIGRYLDSNIAKIMDETRTFLSHKKVGEYGAYQMSLPGILSSFANANYPGSVDNSMMILKATGEWNSKTTEDYIQMCRDNIVADKDLFHDITALTVEWRAAIVSEIGQDRYNQASKQIGCDLAAAYIDYRIQQMMMDRLIDEETPKSTAEYIFKKAAEGSLLGLPQVLSRSPLEAEIAKEAEERYNANGWEWAGAKAVSFGIDTVTTMGCGSWANLAKLAGVEVVFAGIEAYANSKEKDKSITIEECISRGIFDSDENIFDDVRERAAFIDGSKSDGVTHINATLNKPVSTFTIRGLITRAASAIFSPLTAMYDNAKEGIERAAQQQSERQQTKQSAQVENRNTMSAVAEIAARSRQNSELQSIQQPMEENKDNLTNNQDTAQEQQIKQVQEANQAGWGALLSDLGFSGLGDIGKNLGYVIAMLPDILVGTMTGRTQSLHLRDNLIPMASIVAGMFVKNPVMKLLLIGMGGMNLLNKAGHESIERHNNPEGVRFKKYDDEELNPRITAPIINGNCLIANIDRTPCSITLPDKVVAAYQDGALPLNTLANAVLARHEANSRLAQENYRAASEENQYQNNRQIR